MSIPMPQSFKALAESMHVANPQEQWDALVERNRNEMPEPFSWRKWLERAPKAKEEKPAPKHHPMYPPVPKQEWERPLTEEDKRRNVEEATKITAMLDAMSGPKKEERRTKHIDGPMPKAEEVQAIIDTPPHVEAEVMTYVDPKDFEQVVVGDERNAELDTVVQGEGMAAVIVPSTGKPFAKALDYLKQLKEPGEHNEPKSIIADEDELDDLLVD